MSRISLEEYFLIAEKVLGQPAREIERRCSIGRAGIALDAPFMTYEGLELYPGLDEKVAVMVFRLVREHPLHDGNKRVALFCATVLLERNGRRWLPTASADEMLAAIERVLTGQVSERELAMWLGAQIAPDR